MDIVFYIINEMNGIFTIIHSLQVQLESYSLCDISIQETAC